MTEYKPHIETSFVIEFEDVGQEDRIWQVGEEGKVLSSYPKENDSRKGCILDVNELKVGSKPRLLDADSKEVEISYIIKQIEYSPFRFFCSIRGKDPKTFGENIPSIFKKEVDSEKAIFDSNNPTPKIPKRKKE